MSISLPSRAGHRAALLLIDVINDFDFPDAEPLLARAERSASRIEALLARARQAGVPVIYVNDNFGHWRSDFRSTLARCSEPARPSSAIVRRLAPQLDDYFVLKPQHSGFFHTPLDLLLKDLGSEVLVLCGFSTNSCVTFTAHDAHMRRFRVIVPRDTTAAVSEQIELEALHQLELTVHADTRESTALDFARLD
ncbi:MAG TPA: isochorismatase family cysteine hydrolase [Polyangiaceae bacterium]|nr:isochorismatase family cysteine hydrolase [Polyangiaceae bacterium]